MCSSFGKTPSKNSGQKVTLKKPIKPKPSEGITGKDQWQETKSEPF